MKDEIKTKRPNTIKEKLLSSFWLLSQAKPFLCVGIRKTMLSVRFLSTFFMKYYIISTILYF